MPLQDEPGVPATTDDILRFGIAIDQKMLEKRRPPCPKCTIRMYPMQPHSETFECLRCDNIESREMKRA
jgi:hypothetical protein